VPQCFYRICKIYGKQKRPQPSFLKVKDEGQEVVAIHVEASTLREMNFGDFKSEHETWGVSKEKLSCSMVKTFSKVSRVDAL